MFRVWGHAFYVAALVTITAGEAGAQSAFCADLQRQYQTAQRSGGGQGGASAEQVARKLTEKTRLAQQNRCARYAAEGSPTAACPGILGAIADLRHQLARAQSTGSARQSSGPSPATIRQRIVASGCTAPERRTTIARGQQAPGNGLRTLCVRTCDGSYFPIGNSGRRDRHRTDSEACQSMYAEAGQAELFLQLRRDDITTAVSLDGNRPYADQPYAFLFRHGFYPACNTQLKTGLAALAARYVKALQSLPPSAGPKRAAATPPTDWPQPRLRPRAIGEDPETLTALAGGLLPWRETPDESTTAAAPMRHIGERWYADLYDPDKPPSPRATYRAPLGFDLIASAMAMPARDADAAIPTQ